MLCHSGFSFFFISLFILLLNLQSVFSNLDGLCFSLKDPHINVGMSHCASEYEWDMKDLGTAMTVEVRLQTQVELSLLLVKHYGMKTYRIFSNLIRTSFCRFLKRKKS